MAEGKRDKERVATISDGELHYTSFFYTWSTPWNCVISSIAHIQWGVKGNTLHFMEQENALHHSYETTAGFNGEAGYFLYPALLMLNSVISTNLCINVSRKDTVKNYHQYYACYTLCPSQPFCLVIVIIFCKEQNLFLLHNSYYLFMCGSFNFAVNSQYYNAHWHDSSITNQKIFGKKRSSSILGLISAFVWGDRGKLRRTSAHLCGVQPKSELISSSVKLKPRH
jgi:hypothetical protein